MNKPIYVLGTGLSHNGSAVLLKDGKVCVAIEKERLSRIKHDGGNDYLAIQYCLDAENIKLSDIDLVVQCANFEIPERNQYKGKRIFANTDFPKIVNISHHLAHAYSAVGTASFNECNVVVIDGCGSPLDQFLQLHPEHKHLIQPDIIKETKMQCEKDSFYYFNGQKLIPLWKDFSVMSPFSEKNLSTPTTKHSIGGFYASVSKYVFGDMQDVGKLMGLAPYGTSGVYKVDAFEFKESRLFIHHTWQYHFDKPSKGYSYFKKHFSYYANVAKWAQEQVEKAVLECIQYRTNSYPSQNLCYSGGVALNAVANSKLLDLKLVDNIYFEPAAGDNGLALGCAFYGWLEHLNKPKTYHNGNTCFGKSYTDQEIEKAISNESIHFKKLENELDLLHYCAKQLQNGKTIAWFQSGSEFGPRALGRRSILAHPGIKGLKDHINKNIKFREDFRPFAPAILKDKVTEYFKYGRNSPYMILVDKTKPEHVEDLLNVTHYDGSSRVQTVEETWNPMFHKLITEFYNVSGIPMVLNTSLNKKGTPIVETPKEAIKLFKETAIDILIIENYLIETKLQ
ncbi:carbamoyltransferase family protein [Aquimarina rubra]|uniref:Carbamoyltransferase n=1 Tax=Aquimarina rubra TaxID=1920033 RepID=A0ABW5L9K5_9FLAO